jgi:type IX secretion system PorP/SprF family membrane protein
VAAASPACGQQGPQFTHFMFNNLVLNPAYAGADEALSITAVSRSQWSDLEGAPSTQSLSAHSLFRDRVGLGLAIVHDRIGVHRNTNAMASYAYHLKMGQRSFLSLGLQGGIINMRSDYASLDMPNNDPKLQSFINKTSVDVGTGAYFRSPRVDVGFSIPGLLSQRRKTNDTTTIIYRNADVLTYARYRARLNQQLVLEPALLLKYFPQLPLSYDVNVSLVFKQVITGGISYRANESIDALVKLQLTPNLQAGYAYDYPVKNASWLGAPSHELMLHYVFHRNRTKLATPR